MSAGTSDAGFILAAIMFCGVFGALTGGMFWVTAVDASGLLDATLPQCIGGGAVAGGLLGFAAAAWLIYD